MTYKPKKGHVVEVEFWDHSEGDDPIKFVVYGRVQSARGKSITV